MALRGVMRMRKGLIEVVSSVFICAVAMMPFHPQALDALCQGLQPCTSLASNALPPMDDLSQLSDLNGDGCVNILDFQLAVAASQGVNPSQVPQHSSPMAESASPALRLNLRLLAPPDVCAVALVLPLAEAAAAVQVTRDEGARPEPRTERYLFVLCPNAPPSASNFPTA